MIIKFAFFSAILLRVFFAMDICYTVNEHFYIFVWQLSLSHVRCFFSALVQFCYELMVAQGQLVPSSAYKPQVEAISPTLPVDNALENQIRHSRDELVQNIHRVDREITNMDHSIEKLKRKQVCSLPRRSEVGGISNATGSPTISVILRNCCHHLCYHFCCYSAAGMPKCLGIILYFD